MGGMLVSYSISFGWFWAERNPIYFIDIVTGMHILMCPTLERPSFFIFSEFLFIDSSTSGLVPYGKFRDVVSYF